jgi:hypothetical protein
LSDDDDIVLIQTPEGRNSNECEIYVANPKQRPAVEKWINTYAEGQFGFDSNGFLRRVAPNPKTNNPQTSEYYSAKLDEAIRSPKRVTVEVDPNWVAKDNNGNVILAKDGKPKTISHPETGEGVTFNDPLGQRVVLSGNPNTANQVPMSPAEVLLHELLGHAIPGITRRITGDAVKNMNRAIRQIRGLSPWNPLPFDPE